MAEDNIYLVRVHFEGPSQPASIGVYYQESGLSTGVNGPCQSLAESWEGVLANQLANCLSEEWQLSAIVCSKKSGDQVAKHIESLEGRPGTRNGPALPANNAILVQLFQTAFPKTSNGRLYIPGVSESDTNVGRLEQDFSDGPLSVFVGRVAQSINELNGTGLWLPGVISAKVRDAIPGQKLWEDSFSTMVGALGWPVIARQRRRQTKVVGAF